jgi:hypothetical protein
MTERRSEPGAALLAVVLLVGGAALRWVGLGSYPFHQDELFTLIEATGLFNASIEPGIRARPLYYLLQHPLLGVLPQTELGLRLPAFVFGLMGMGATWVVGTRLYGSAVGLFALFVVVISPWHLLVSGLARYWSLIYLAALAAFWLMVRAYATDRPRDYLAALAGLLVGAFTHPSYLFAVAGVAVGLSLVRDDGRVGLRLPSRYGWAYLWLPFAGAVLAGLAALWITGSESSLRNFEGRGIGATLRLVPAVVESLSLTYVLMGVTGAALLAAYGETIERRRWGLMTLGGCLSTSGLLVAASFYTDVYWTHATAMVPLLILSSAGLVELGRQRLSAGRSALVWIAAAVHVAGVLPDTLSQLSDGSRFDYRPAFSEIEALDPDALVLMGHGVIRARYAPGLRSRHLNPDPIALASTLAGEERMWVITSVTRKGIPGDRSGDVSRWLARHCRWVHSHERQRFDFRQFRVDLHYCGGGDWPAQSPGRVARGMGDTGVP